MTEIATEDDLCKLFFKKPTRNAHKKKGDSAIYYKALRQVLDAKVFGPTHNKRLVIKDESRLYLAGRGLTTAVVRQCDLRDVARAVDSSGGGDTFVSYLGAGATAPKKEPAPQFKTPDSLDKIVTAYFALMTTQRFEWRGKTYEPLERIWVGRGIGRGFTCPAGCGGCCPRFSLDYIEPDFVPKRHPLKMRVVEFDGRQVEVWSDLQTDHGNEKCRNLNLDDGRCNIHGKQPFSCDFELLRVVMKKDRPSINQQLYGRGWMMKRVDGERGALCEMTEALPHRVQDTHRRLERLTTWMEHFGLDASRILRVQAAIPEVVKTGKGAWVT